MIWPAAILDLPARGAHEGSRVGTKGWAPQGAKQKDNKERKKKCCCSKLVLDIESPIQGSYFNAQFHRLASRRGPKKAVCAVAASILTTIYHMIKDGTQFEDLGADHFDRRSKDVRAKRLVTQLAKLGFDAKLTPLAKAA